MRPRCPWPPTPRAFLTLPPSALQHSSKACFVVKYESRAPPSSRNLPPQSVVRTCCSARARLPAARLLPIRRYTDSASVCSAALKDRLVLRWARGAGPSQVKEGASTACGALVLQLIRALACLSSPPGACCDPVIHSSAHAGDSAVLGTGCSAASSSAAVPNGRDAVPRSPASTGKRSRAGFGTFAAALTLSFIRVWSFALSITCVPTSSVYGRCAAILWLTHRRT